MILGTVPNPAWMLPAPRRCGVALSDVQPARERAWPIGCCTSARSPRALLTRREALSQPRSSVASTCGAHARWCQYAAARLL